MSQGKVETTERSKIIGGLTDRDERFKLDSKCTGKPLQGFKTAKRHDLVYILLKDYSLTARWRDNWREERKETGRPVYNLPQ